jgi:hypothetical protein
MTVRQIFYAAVVAGLVPKTSGYQKVQRLTAKMRRQGALSYSFIADGTRWMRLVQQWDSLDDFVEAIEGMWRLNLWRDQKVRIEVWLEKDALADVVYETTSKWRVPLMVSRGQSSLTFLHSAAMDAAAAYRNHGAETWIYALYDHDAGGDRAARAIAKDLPGFARVPIHFERLAVTLEQIEEWDLPTRPPTRTDPEAGKWGDKPAVELDAIPVDRLHELVEEAITRHINFREWEVQKVIEEEARRGVRALRRGLDGDWSDWDDE